MPPSFFARNRKNLLKNLKGNPLIVVAAHAELQRSRDTTYPFEQDKHFWYLCGLAHPDFVLAFTRDAQWLIRPPRSEVQRLFDGDVLDDEIKAHSGIKDIVDFKTGWQRIRDTAGQVDSIGTVLAPRPRLMHFFTNPNRRELRTRLLKAAGKDQIRDITPELSKLRLVKTPAEAALIQKAVDITGEALRSLWQRLPGLNSEAEAEAEITRVFRTNLADHAFDPIVASADNAITLHYTGNNAPLRTNQFLLTDIGARVDQYNADITRTAPLAQVSRRHRDVYNAVLSVQRQAISEIKPGLTYEQLEERVVDLMGVALKNLKLITKTDKRTIRQYYPHMGHFLGLDVHDVGSYRDYKFEPGVVLTVEPGIYLPKEGIGVRIEDDVIVTKTGARIISADIPVDLAEITAIIGKK